ncbi:MAG: polyphosphate kinase 1 [Candidatus Aminicenantes bacterium]|jgi:polyphosphate kinase
MEEQSKTVKEKPQKTHISKELSWLTFNERVLLEAADPTVPLMERLKFLGIFSSNLDEFFRVRVATLNRLRRLGKKAKKLTGHDPAKVLKQVQKTVIRQHKRFDTIYQQLLKDMCLQNIFIINEKELNEEQTAYIESYFDQEVRPTLVPIMVDQVEKFPKLKDQSIYLAVHLFKKELEEKAKYALIEVPTDVVPRFLILPNIEGKKYIILLDDVIRHQLGKIFSFLPYDMFEAYTIKLTRDAELEIDDDLTESYIKKVSSSLKKRKGGLPVRFIYDSAMPESLLAFLTRKLHLTKDDTIIPGSKYHNFKDFMNFPDMGLKRLKYRPAKYLPHKDLGHKKSLFKVLSKKDILLHFPYQSFHPVIDLLREAAIDPKVTSIKVTLYRLAKNSAVVNTLINAVNNGKSVFVVMELQARFDEEANIFWAHRLQDEGVRVIYGVPGLKVHSKLCLIERREKGGIKRFAIIGTGNLNEDTAKIYSDHTLFTTDRRLTNEVAKVFEFYADNYKTTTFSHLIVSPWQMRKKILKLIKNEIKNVETGKEAYIHWKLNNLVDAEIINCLYSASQAGVKIQLNVRGMFSLVPGIPGMSENIEAIRIVDKYLEHTRIFVFCNGGDEKIYISSADIMPRNLDRRVEVICPIYDKSIQEELGRFLDLQWKDNLKARLHSDGTLHNCQENASKKNRAQVDIYNYLQKAKA